jgi:xanthine dehydrogenase iron-sulfur cluster and FAD-binding subunit A
MNGSVRDDLVALQLTVNGRECTLNVEPRTTLLDALREELALTGTKKACDRAECGACTVHIGGAAALSCMTVAGMQDGTQITRSKDRGGAERPILYKRHLSHTMGSNVVFVPPDRSCRAARRSRRRKPPGPVRQRPTSRSRSCSLIYRKEKSANG